MSSQRHENDAIKEDLDVRAVLNISGELAPLEPDARQRVVRFFADRYLPAAAIATRPARGAGEASEILLVGEIGDVGDFVEQAQPITKTEHALVVAYFLERHGRSKGWKALELNDLLKGIGCRLSNVTRILEAQRTRRPARIRQVGKAGPSRQAHKTYVLTVSGHNTVDEMLQRARPGRAAELA